MPWAIAAAVAAQALSSWLGSRAAGNASSAQLAATKYAADMEAKSQQAALDFQKQVWADTQSNQAPWMAAGRTALGQLSAGTAPGGTFMQPWTNPFKAPQLNETTDPGYHARFQLGKEALEHSASARGTLLTGGALKDLNQFAQDYASNEYQNVYNRAMGEYNTAYNIFETNQANQFNRLASLAGIGQTATNQLAASGGQTAANVSNTYMQGGAALADLATQAGNATASGYMGSANAWGQGLGNIGNDLMSYYLWSRMKPTGTGNSQIV